MPFILFAGKKRLHNSDQAQVFITFPENIVTKALIFNNGKMKTIQRITQTDCLKCKNIFVTSYDAPSSILSCDSSGQVFLNENRKTILYL